MACKVDTNSLPLRSRFVESISSVEARRADFLKAEGGTPSWCKLDVQLLVVSVWSAAAGNSDASQDEALRPASVRSRAREISSESNASSSSTDVLFAARIEMS